MSSHRVARSAALFFLSLRLHVYSCAVDSVARSGCTSTREAPSHLRCGRLHAVCHRERASTGTYCAVSGEHAVTSLRRWFCCRQLAGVARCRAQPAFGPMWDETN
jgi:hypothetical protein